MPELLAETSNVPIDVAHLFPFLALLAVLAAAFVIYSGFKCGYLPPPQARQPPEFLPVAPQETTGPDPHFVAPADRAGPGVEIYIGEFNVKVDRPGLSAGNKPFDGRVAGFRSQRLESRDPWEH